MLLTSEDNLLLERYLAQEGIPSSRRATWLGVGLAAILNAGIAAILVLSTQYQWVHNLALFVAWVFILFLTPLMIGILGWSSWNIMQNMNTLTDDEIREKFSPINQGLATVTVHGFFLDAMVYLTMAVIGWTVTALACFFASFLLLLPRVAMMAVFMGLIEQIRTRGLVRDSAESQDDEQEQDLTEPESAL